MTANMTPYEQMLVEERAALYLVMSDVTSTMACAIRLALARIRTARSLGLGNIARVASYRLRLRAGIHPVQRISAGAPPRAPFFGVVAVPWSLPVPHAWQHAGNYFGWYRPGQGNGPPDWHRNPLDSTLATDTDADWWTIPDFDPALGDIKTIWEASRFDWVVNFSQRAKAGTSESIERLNLWLADWCHKNPPYKGHNWKCGQEASIRVMHLAIAALILEETKTPLPALTELLTTHLQRIAPTLSYAMAQDNNHGTSEAAALFIGGSWLEMLGRPTGRRWHLLGRKWLENRAQRLIQPDGSFSQHSVNYHRLVLDTFSLAEIWRRHLQLHPFSRLLQARAAAACDWLRAMVDPATGDAPNLGGNDGANLLPLTDADYRDYRPSVHLAATLFQDESGYVGPGPWQTHVRWLGAGASHHTRARAHSTLFDDGGYAVIKRGDAKVLFRYPRFRFRPSDADALHVDLWVSGENLLRDGGTFSYNGESEWQTYFSGAGAHNTVQFDDHQQMPRLGRFLWGNWLKIQALLPIHEYDGATIVAASYTDGTGSTHARNLELREGRLTVRDTISGFSRRAVLRWRLRPVSWTLHGLDVTDGHHRLAISADAPIIRCELVTGWESRYYLQKTALPVLEVELASPGVVTSEYRWIQ